MLTAELLKLAWQRSDLDVESGLVPVRTRTPDHTGKSKIIAYAEAVKFLGYLQFGFLNWLFVACSMLEIIVVDPAAGFLER